MKTEQDEYLGYVTSSESSREWVENLEDYVEHVLEGKVDYIDEKNTSLFVKRSEVLLIVFESAQEVLRRNNARLPTAWEIACAENWSYLAVVSELPGWPQGGAIAAYFSELKARRSLDHFTSVVLLGIKGGSGAAYLSGQHFKNATAVIIQPESVAKPDEQSVAYEYQQPLSNFSDAGTKLIVAHDPLVQGAPPFLSLADIEIRCRHFGTKTDQFLRAFEVTPKLLKMAVNDTYNELEIYQLLRKRKHFRSYWRNVLSKIDLNQRPWLATVLCQNVLRLLGGLFKTLFKAA